MKTILLAAAVLGLSGAAQADEVIIHRDAPAVVDPGPTTSKTVETHDDGAGCASKTVHKENDAGDSKTVHTQNCD